MMPISYIQSFVSLWDNAFATSAFSKLQSPRVSSPCGTAPLQPQLSQRYYPSEPYPLVGQHIYHFSFLKATISWSLVSLWDYVPATSAFSKLLSFRASSPCGTMPLPFQFSQSCYLSELYPLVGWRFSQSSLFKAAISQSLVFLWEDVSTTSTSLNLLSPRASSSCGTTPLPFQLFQSCYPSEPHILVGWRLCQSSFLKVAIS